MPFSYQPDIILATVHRQPPRWEPRVFRNREREQELEALLDKAHRRNDETAQHLAHAQQQVKEALDQNQQLLGEWRAAHDERVRLQGDVDNLMNLGRWKDDQLATLQGQNATQAHEIAVLQQTLAAEREQARRHVHGQTASIEGLQAALTEARQGQAAAEMNAAALAQQLQQALPALEQIRDMEATIRQLSRDNDELAAANHRLAHQLDDARAMLDVGTFEDGQRTGGTDGRPGWVYSKGQGWIPDDLGQVPFPLLPVEHRPALALVPAQREQGAAEPVDTAAQGDAPTDQS